MPPLAPEVVMAIRANLKYHTNAIPQSYPSMQARMHTHLHTPTDTHTDTDTDIHRGRGRGRERERETRVCVCVHEHLIAVFGQRMQHHRRLCGNVDD